MHRSDQGHLACSAVAHTSRPSIDRSADSSPSLHRSTSTTATHSTSFAVRRSRSKHLRSQASIQSLPDMISPEEYAALPASIQKKYFSSKERPCIAQQSAAQGRKKQHGKLGSWLSSTSTSDLHSTRPSTSGGLHTLKPKSRPHDPKLFLVRFDEDSISVEEARWFLSLPEKVKTKRFSREELVSLTARAHRVLDKPSSECSQDKAQRRRSVHCLEASACTPLGASSSSSAASTIVKDNIQLLVRGETETEQAQATVITPSRIPTNVVEISKIKHVLRENLPAETDQAVETAVDPADAEMEILKLYLKRRSLKPKASTNMIKRSPPGSPPTGAPQPTKKKSHQRLHLLTPLPLPPPVLAPAPRSQNSTPFSTSARLSRPFINNDPLALDSDAQVNGKQHNDCVHVPAETPPPVLQVEGQIFELPANEDPAPLSTDEDCPYPHLISAFSDDETEDDEKEDDDDLDTESVETIGPRTPSPTNHRSSTIQQATGDSGVDLPELHLDARKESASILERTSSSLSDYGSHHASIGSHAPHVLRTSSEEILYAYQRRLTSGVDVETTDPLALQALPVSEDHTGAHGAFAQEGGATLAPGKGLKRVFRSFRRL